jgi:hypothetical protein
MKALFLLLRGAQASQAIIHGHAAAVAAVAPPPLGLGPVFGKPLSLIMLAGGYASAGAIMSQAFEGGGGGFSAAGGYGGGTPTSPVVTQPTPMGSPQRVQEVNIQIHGTIVESDGWVRNELAASIKKALSDGADFGL